LKVAAGMVTKGTTKKKECNVTKKKTPRRQAPADR
jgi:hypothetical protein